MSIELPKIHDLASIDTPQIHQHMVLAQNPSIIMLGQPSQPSQGTEERIPRTFQLSTLSQHELTLAFVQHVNLSGRFSINLNSKTDLSEPVDEFLDAQGAQLSSTFSDHEIPFGLSPLIPPHDGGQVLDPSSQQLIPCQ